MKRVIDNIPFMSQLIGAAVASYVVMVTTRVVLSVPVVQDFLFGMALPFLGFTALMLLWLKYGEHLVRAEDSEQAKERSIQRRIAEVESAERQEAYYHSRGLCLNCSPRLSGRDLEALQTCARLDAGLTLSRLSKSAQMMS